MYESIIKKPFQKKRYGRNCTCCFNVYDYRMSFIQLAWNKLTSNDSECGRLYFLIISGILYSTKRITQPWSFIKMRWSKLCIPMYLLVLFLLIYNVVDSEYDAFRSIPTYLANLQGLGFIVYGLDLPQMDGLSLYVYMTHYMFLVGPFYINVLPCSKAVQLLSFAVGTLISASFLKLLSQKTFQILFH